MVKKNIGITTPFIKLDQLLKFANLVESGADAKDMILCKLVAVNGYTCTMRGKKIRVGDVVTIDFEDEVVELTVGEE